MKITLVAQNASFSHTNLAVRALRCTLAQKGYEVNVIETTVNDRGGVFPLLEKLLNERADLYGFSVYIWNRREQLYAAEHLKKLMPQAVILFGGPEVSYEGEDFFLQYPFIDHLLRGEGEEAFVRLLSELEKGEAVRIYETGAYSEFETTPEPYLCHPYACDNSSTLSGKLVYYESARGCPFSCSYCLSSTHGVGKRVRAKTVKTTLAELARLAQCGARTIKILDRTFNFDKDRTKEIFRALIDSAVEQTSETGYTGVTYHFEICARLLDDETITLLAQAPKGLLRFEIGVQSTDPAVLKRIDRTDDVKKTLAVIQRLKAGGNILLHLDLIAGLPGETFAGVRKSFDDSFRYADLLQLGFLKLLPGTKLRREAEEDGTIFLSEPPYQVLQTSRLSFAELRELTKVEETLTLLTAKDSFQGALSRITSRVASPFDFFHAFSRTLPDTPVARNRLYEMLCCFSLGYPGAAETEEEKSILRSLFLFDFLLNNQGAPPRLLTEEETEKHLAHRMRALLTDKQKNSQFGKLFLPSCEYYTFPHDRENGYIIDRKNRIFEKIPLKSL